MLRGRGVGATTKIAAAKCPPSAPLVGRVGAPALASPVMLLVEPAVVAAAVAVEVEVEVEQGAPGRGPLRVLRAGQGP